VLRFKNVVQKRKKNFFKDFLIFLNISKKQVSQKLLDRSFSQFQISMNIFFPQNETNNHAQMTRTINLKGSSSEDDG
jgi:hypothetical protein